MLCCDWQCVEFYTTQTINHPVYKMSARYKLFKVNIYRQNTYTLFEEQSIQTQVSDQKAINNKLRTQ